MLLSELLGERYKEKPSDAQLISHIFLLRGGYIRQVSNGIFTLLTPARRIALKIEAILREEMDSIGGQEVLFPVALPADLWRESGRYDSVGSELLRFKDRTGRDMLLGMTHEEAAVHLARSEIKSYTQYPFMIYQIQTKFRDEPRSRGGLVRVREFTMKDGYSFHTSQQDLENYYDIVFKAYEKIYKRAGLSGVISVKSDTGMMGGNVAHEFMYLSDGGEDSLVVCPECGYSSNMEVAVSKVEHDEKKPAKEQKTVYTPDLTDIKSLTDFFGIAEKDTIKATVFKRTDNDKTVIVFIRGDREVNESKLEKILKSEVRPLTSEDETDLVLGFVGITGDFDGDIEVYYDETLVSENDMVTGGNKIDYHITGINISELKIDKFYDISKVNDGDECVACGSHLQIKRGIEVGNIFQLGKKYSESMDMTYVDRDGQLKIPTMGCYGIGVGRLLACIIEEHHDENGPIWPMSVAPWQIHINVLNSGDEDVREVGRNLYSKLGEKFEVVMDDREVGAGFQFADADLLGVPVRLVVSRRNLKNNVVEVSTRDKKVKLELPIDEVLEGVEELISKLK
ncbi:MAG: proline--tRNA ligase [Ruminococcaceae bacterium]|nr:proline--tRNA ligase [Oscillospiraceae bacterium]